MPASTPRASSRRRAAVVTAFKPALVVARAWWFGRVVRRVDWPAVRDAISGLAPAEAVALLLVVAVRQCLNAGPLAIFVLLLGLRRAVAGDLSANLVATVAPPPGDVVLRIAMLRSWGIEAGPAIAGISLNTLTYDVARFGAPLLGLTIALAAGQAEPAYAWTALTSGAISLAVVVALLVSYPLTALPLGGIGVLDGAVLALLDLEQGPYEAAAIAGLVVFRVCWQLVPPLLGAVTMAWWRRTHVAEANAVRSATRAG